MLIHVENPDDYEMVHTYSTCSFHKEHPNVWYAGCCCTATYYRRRKEDAVSTDCVEVNPKTLGALYL